MTGSLCLQHRRLAVPNGCAPLSVPLIRSHTAQSTHITCDKPQDQFTDRELAAARLQFAAAAASVAPLLKQLCIDTTNEAGFSAKEFEGVKKVFIYVVALSTAYLQLGLQGLSASEYMQQ
jgi:hypothetical protein